MREFEKVGMGLEGPINGRNDEDAAGTVGPNGEDQSKGIKRKFEVDEANMIENVKSERARARKALDDEKVWH